MTITFYGKTLMWIDEDKCLLCEDDFTMIGSKIVLINILYLNHNLGRSNACHNAKKSTFTSNLVKLLE